MADISAEIAAFQNAVYGEDVRGSMVSLANKLNERGIETSNIVDGAVTTDKIADDAVTMDKLADTVILNLSSLDASVSVPVSFKNAGITIDTGRVVDGISNRLVSISELPSRVVRITLPESIQAVLYCYRYSDAYIGCFNGTTLSTSTVYAYENYVDIRKVRETIKTLTSYDCEIMVILKKSNDSSISTSDISEVKFLALDSMSSFELLPFEKGRIAADTGKPNIDASNKARSTQFIPPSTKIMCPDGFNIEFYYEYSTNGTYVKRVSVNQAVFTTPNDGTKKYKLVINKKDDSDFTINDLKEYDTIDILSTKVNEINNTIQTLGNGGTDASVSVPVSFKNAGITIDTGRVVDGISNRLVSISELPSRVVRITLPESIQAVLYCYRYSDAYIGCFNGTTLSTSTVYAYENYVDIRKVRETIKTLTSYDCEIMVILKKSNDSSISTSDISEVKFLALDSMSSFELLPFEKGRIAADTGKPNIDASNKARSTQFIPPSTKIMCPDGFNIEFYYEYSTNGTYVKRVSVNQAVFTTPNDGTKKYKLVINKKDDSDFTINDLKEYDTIDILSTKVNEINNTIQTLDLSTTSLEGGGIDAAGVLGAKITTRVRTVDYLHGDTLVILPSGYRVYRVFYYDDNDCFKQYTVADDSNIYLVKAIENYKYKIVFSTTNTNDDIRPEDIKGIKHVKEFKKIIFDKDYDIVEFPSILQGFDLSQNGYYYTIMPQVYSAFDELIEDYPNLIQKTDAAQLVGLSYPSYADYKTWMYTIDYQNTSASHNKYCIKPKMFIISGQHGSETAAPLNVFIFVKRLLSESISNPNLYKLLTGVTFYIIPCVNGYGMNHYTRINGNGVDINRNYPIEKWVKSGSQYDDTYTGDSPASEFETQLVMGITDYVKPDIALDHHNYDHMACQFYTECNYDLIPIMYQALTECSFAFQKKYPAHFGTAPRLLINRDAGAPFAYISDTYTTSMRWWIERGIQVPAVCEVSNRINYQNGSVYNDSTETYSVHTFAIAQYTLINVIIKCVEALLA